MLHEAKDKNEKARKCQIETIFTDNRLQRDDFKSMI